MKRLLVWVGLPIATLATAWFVWALITDQAVASWLADREDEGWTISIADQSVTGFPIHFMTRLHDLNVTDPSTSWIWSASEITFRQAAWDLGRVEAAWPMFQSVTSVQDTFTIDAESLSSVLDVQPSAAFALDGATTLASDVTLTSAHGDMVELASAQGEIVRLPDAAARYRIHIDARDLVLPNDVVTALSPERHLPAVIPVVRLDAEAAFDRIWDITAFETARPQPTHLRLDDVTALWGAIEVGGSGSLDIDGAGRATGTINVQVRNWDRALDIAVRSGAVSAGLASTARTGLSLLGGLSGSPDDIDATLRFEDGFMFFGPLPVGEAPRLRLP
jgi:hypothetical protein